MTTFILNIILFTISQLAFSTSISYAYSSDSDNLLVSSEDIKLISLETDLFSDTDDDETLEYYLAAEINIKTTQKSIFFLRGNFFNNTSEYLDLLHQYIDLPPPSNY